MTEKEAAYKRHSVRSYEDKKIEQEKVRELNALITTCNEEGNLHLQLLEDAGGTFGHILNKVMGLGSAPSVIACVGPDDETLEERIGYYGEKIVLFAQTCGLNTCWAGTFKADKTPCILNEGERLVIVIAIGYGKSQGKMHRSRHADQVVKGGIEDKPEWFCKGVEYALLAPTAINQQKFEISLKEDGTAEIREKGGIFGKVDLGIVRYHFELGSHCE